MKQTRTLRTALAVTAGLSMAALPVAPSFAQATEPVETATPDTKPTGAPEESLHDAIGGDTKSFLDKLQSWMDDRYERKTTPAPEATDEAPPVPAPAPTPVPDATVPAEDDQDDEDAPDAPTNRTPTTSPVGDSEDESGDDAEQDATGQETAEQDTTGGTGGQPGEQLNVEFTNDAGTTSSYHIFVPEGDDPKGLIFWGDGSGGHGFEHPEQEYLIGGDEGLAAVAAARNMILVVPLAPEPGCPSSNCWYDDNGTEKAQWASDLMTQVKSQYDINEDQIVVGGYSSGAQFTTQFFGPNHAEEQSVDLLLPMAYGSPGDLDGISADYASDTWIVFNTGTNDHPAYGAAERGAAAYEAAGFNVDWEESTTTHDRGGDFGPFVAENIDDHLLNATAS